MALSIQTLQGILQGAVAAIQSACSAITSIGSGSPALAIAQADASQWSVQQANIWYVYSATRLSSSTGTDVDTFVNDFGLYREPATSAVGNVTLSLSTGSSATILVGQQVLTGDGTQAFAVTEDAANPYWNTAAAGYVLPVVPVAAVTPGSAGNVSAGAISLFGDAIAGFTGVTNQVAFVGGLDVESDAALKVRFIGYVASLEAATYEAVVSAINGVQQGLTCFVRPCINPAGVFQPGYFTVIVDDGSGTPPTSLLNAVFAAVDKVRPITVWFSVQPPTVVQANITLTLTVLGNGKAALIPQVAEAIEAYVNTLPVGTALSLTKVSAIAYGVSATITNVSGVLIDNIAADLVASPTQVVKVTTAPNIT
jgi:uncharacterized phage protein gp47/JayE